ncbi:PREDICTED: pro-neuregulin-4, membrane-bound isoform-like [Poecilia mexicana]|uniref:EGF-like domain-containing protein n=1 Tax=Poecilia mexicana TaxID=48701 RepID=A0A3B3YKU0_9TELE|nr:PREDICTED: pro-neuregulin-4, membrane-bound isoform-like [Poecilia mexicana]
MMAEHGKPCDPSEATFCMNEASCYKLPAMETLSCICRENYKGIRCEEYHLPSYSQDGYDRGLLAAIIVVAIIVLVVLAVIIYHIQKMVKEKPSQKNDADQTKKLQV